MMRRLGQIGIALSAYFVIASAALAQQPTEGGYGGVGGNIQGDVQGGGSLPFTGLDLVLLVGAGMLLLVAGLALRRVGRTSS